MKTIAASLALLLAAGLLFAAFILAEVYPDVNGGPQFEPEPRSGAAADPVPGRVDADRAPQPGDGGTGGGRAGLPGRDGSRLAPEAPELAAAVERIEGELDAEKARTAALTDELAAAKRTAAAVEPIKGELDAEKARTAALTDELAAAKRTAAAELTSAEGRLDGERVRSADLIRDLARARDQIARTFHDRVLEAGRRAGAEEALVGERIRHAAAPEAGDDALPVAVRLGMGLFPAGRQDDATGPASPGRSSARLPDGPERPAEQDRGARRASGEAADAWASLPDGIGAHVTVQYARGSEPAHRRALVLSQMLQAEGIDVAGPVDAPSPAKDGRVTYYYAADRASAERVAGLCAAPSPIRGRLPPRGRLPRPGTVGIAVAD